MENGKFRWCNYEWTCEMEGGRIIHPSYPHTWYSNDENVLVRMRNGELHFYYKEHPRKVKYWDGKEFYPTIERALIRTTTPFDYGVFSLEMMMPKGLNVTSAFWLSGDGNWPPEIDIAENWSDDCNYWHKFTNHFPWFGSSWRTTWNVHYNNSKLKHKHIGSMNIRTKDQPLDPTENWVKYECIWKPEEIIFKANDEVTGWACKKYAKKLVSNLNTPEKGYLMDVIIDINVDDPKIVPNKLETPLKVRNFKYDPLD